MAGSMCLVVVQTTVQRVIANALLGRVVAVFATAEAAVTLGGSAAGPFVAQAVGFTGAGGVAATVTLAAAILTWLAVPNSPPARPGRPRRRQLSPASPR
jgi:predicted MFS family arabinose efflux permease